MSTFTYTSKNSVLIHPCKSENEIYSFSFATYNFELHDENWHQSPLLANSGMGSKKLLIAL